MGGYRGLPPPGSPPSSNMLATYCDRLGAALLRLANDSMIGTTVIKACNKPLQARVNRWGGTNLGQRRGHRQTAAISGQKTRGKRWKGENCIGQAQAQAHVHMYLSDRFTSFLPQSPPRAGFHMRGCKPACVHLPSGMARRGRVKKNKKTIK